MARIAEYCPPPASRTRGQAAAVRLGFVPLTDCAPLLVARAHGLFERHGLRVVLSRELGWASVRAKLAYGELDATHAPATFPLALTHGIDGPAAECVAALVLNLNGNAITLSRRLAAEGVHDAASLATHLRSRRPEPPVFGIVSNHSSHPFLLRRWLAAGGLAVGRDVQVAVVPPQQLWANLRAGHLEGFCAGEPWNSAAILGGDGVPAATSGDLAPRHPEKVLAVRGAWATAHPGEHLRLVAALIEACRLCEDPAFREDLVALLGRPDALNLPARVVRPALDGRFPMDRDTTRERPDFLVFHRHDANAPTVEKARWVADNLLSGRLPARPTPALFERAFRMDLFEAARRVVPSHETQSNPSPEHAPHSLPA